MQITAKSAEKYIDPVGPLRSRINWKARYKPLLVKFYDNIIRQTGCHFDDLMKNRRKTPVH